MQTELQLHQRSRHRLWTDKHLAGQLLKAHLELDNDVASRNRKTMARTVEWIGAEIPADARIVDLGCGPGLYAARFAALRFARQSSRRQGLAIDYIRGNYLRRVPGQHDVALCIYCDFGALRPSEQSLFLRNVHAALTSGGLLFFDAFMDGISATKRVGRHWSWHARGGFWSPEPYYLLEETRHFPDECAWGYRAIVVDAKTGASREYVLWDYYFTQESITALLRRHGFAVEAFRRDLVAANDFASNDVLFVKARKKT